MFLQNTFWENTQESANVVPIFVAASVHNVQPLGGLQREGDYSLTPNEDYPAF